MKFNEVAEAFNEIQSVSSRNKITELLADLFKKATSREASLISYLSLGELSPVYVGTQFNIADKSLYTVIAKLFGESLENIKRRAKQKGDLGLVIEEGPKHRLVEELSLTQVNKFLHEIHDISGTGSQEKKESKLIELLKKLDPLSGKYIVRIILGKLRLGFSDMTLLDAFSWMKMGDKSLRLSLEEAYNVSADIGHLVFILKEEGIRAIEKMKVEVGIPLRPAAAERASSAAAVIKRLGECVAQPKLDGFRLQVHLDNRTKTPKVHFYSRNLQDMSEMFPDLKKAVCSLKVKTLVAEGEAIAYDQETDTFLPFQETVKRKRKHKIEKAVTDFPLKLYFFDLLHLNGKTFFEMSHAERRKELLKLFKSLGKEARDIIYPIEEKKITTSKELEEYFEENVSSGLEGLVIKKPDAMYKAGKRNFNWIKLKREESGELADTIDCVILGYYSGHGKRTAFGIGSFLVGIYNKKDDGFQTIAKIGTGLTDSGWKELKKKCDEVAVKNKPRNVECSKGLVPDVWISPEIVCAVRADEITHSPLHTAGKTSSELGYALRFPRFMQYRGDKSSEDATTIKEVKSLFEIQFKKRSKK
ncbi:ATP-dependent DNA ligase [Candidatus Babeliales bacterium]|nr:ATP-dependent DNA ligase [Candidatus Babeliales bacterium]